MKLCKLMKHNLKSAFDTPIKDCSYKIRLDNIFWNDIIKPSNKQFDYSLNCC
jgi:hypothetical protein